MRKAVSAKSQEENMEVKRHWPARRSLGVGGLIVNRETPAASRR